jgi:hypothetical protein
MEGDIVDIETLMNQTTEPPTGDPKEGDPPAPAPEGDLKAGDPPATDPPTETKPIVAGDQEDWYWDKESGVKGTGEKPDWLLAKYEDAKNQGKGYAELEKQFGAFTGAPKDGEYALDQVKDQFKEAGFELDKDDPLLNEFIEFAKNKNMNQESFNDGLKMYAMSKEADNIMMQEVKANEMKMLGDTGDKQIQDMKDWGKANLSEDEFEGLLQAFPTAEAFKTGLKLIAMTRPNAVSPTKIEPAPGLTEKDVQEMQFKKDEHGNRLINVDPEAKRQYEEASKQVRGTQRHVEMIGPE